MDKTRQQLVLDIVRDIASLRRNMAVHRHEAHPPEQHLSGAQAELLFTVAHNQGLSIKDLAETMHVTGSAVTQLVESLVKIDMLVRESDPDDRRACCVRLSKKGSERFKKFKDHFIKKLSKLLNPLSDDELATFSNLFKKILENQKPQK